MFLFRRVAVCAVFLSEYAHMVRADVLFEVKKTVFKVLFKSGLRK